MSRRDVQKEIEKYIPKDVVEYIIMPYVTMNHFYPIQVQYPTAVVDETWLYQKIPGTKVFTILGSYLLDYQDRAIGRNLIRYYHGKYITQDHVIAKDKIDAIAKWTGMNMEWICEVEPEREREDKNPEYVTQKKWVDY